MFYLFSFLIIVALVFFITLLVIQLFLTISFFEDLCDDFKNKRNKTKNLISFCLCLIALGILANGIINLTINWRL
jgi:hypothetical protein